MEFGLFGGEKLGGLTTVGLGEVELLEGGFLEAVESGELVGEDLFLGLVGLVLGGEQLGELYLLGLLLLEVLFQGELDLLSVLSHEFLKLVSRKCQSFL